MARIIVCDRCQKEIERREVVGAISFGFMDTRTGAIVSGENPFKEWDFCDECMGELDDLIRHKYTIREVIKEEEIEDIDIEEDLEEEPEEEPAEEPKAEEKPQKAKKVDVAAIKVLYEAGWSVKDIADDPKVKVSEATVYNYIKKMGLERRR